MDVEEKLIRKKNILFMPSWYPTSDNPLAGSFFKEQANILKDNFDIVILHYVRSVVGFKRYLLSLFNGNSYSVVMQDCEEGVQDVSIKILTTCCDNLIKKIIGKILTFNKKNNRNEQNALQTLKKELSTKINFEPKLLYAVTAQVNAVDAKTIANFFNIPYVVAEHCPFPLPQTSISAETKCAIENANAIVSISRDKNRQMFMQGLQFQPELVGNMVDEDVFTLPIKKHDGVFTIIIVAANNFYKDYPTFFKTMQRLRSICSVPFKLLIVGFSPAPKSMWSEGEEEFKKMVSVYGFLDICELVPKASRSEMPSYYHKADVFVMTSIQEGFPVSSLEATACGLPVYATRCGGVEDFIDDENGRIVNIQDSEMLSNELKELLEGKVTYNAEVIRKKTVDNYGKKIFLNKMSMVFNRVIEDYAEKNK